MESSGRYDHAPVTAPGFRWLPQSPTELVLQGERWFAPKPATRADSRCKPLHDLLRRTFADAGIDSSKAETFSSCKTSSVVPSL